MEYFITAAGFIMFFCITSTGIMMLVIDVLEKRRMSVRKDELSQQSTLDRVGIN